MKTGVLPINCSREIVYTIIVPHQNMPDLLQRCLASIPERDDIQVIVVDDNSNPRVVDFEHFPGAGRKNVEIIFDKQERGLGHVRNVGLDHARGKWVLFCDSDDYFAEDFPMILDEMAAAEEDLVFFGIRSVLSENPAIPARRTEYVNQFISQYLHKDRDESNLRCRFPIVMCKLFRRDIIERHSIRCDETHWGNDIYFSARYACVSPRIRVTERIGYVITVRQGSLISNFCGTRAEVSNRLQEALKAERLYARYGIKPNSGLLSNWFLWITYRKHGFMWCMWTGLSFLFRPDLFKTMSLFLTKRAVENTGIKTVYRKLTA